MNKQELIELATNPDATQEQLLMLFRQFDEVINRLLAKHPKVTADNLESLAESYDEETLKNIVMNPNVPIETMLKFGAKFPTELLKNPSLKLLFDKDPNLLKDIPSVFEQPECPEHYVRWAAEKGSPMLKLSVLRNPSVPLDIREKLSPDYFYKDAVSKLEKFIQKLPKAKKDLEVVTQDIETKLIRVNWLSKFKRYFEFYMQTALPYCLPKFLPFDWENSSHRLDDQALKGFPFTSSTWPWPTDVHGYHLNPTAQLNLERAGKLLGEDLGGGLLQVWHMEAEEPLIRVIPASSLSETMDSFYPEYAPWLESYGGGSITMNETNLPHPRIEWLPMGRMFPSLCHTFYDWWESDLEITYEEMEELSDKIDSLEIPYDTRNYFGSSPSLRLGGFPDGSGNYMDLVEWPTYGSDGCVIPEKMLLYMVSDDIFCLAVKFHRDAQGNVVFSANISCDR